MKSKLLEQERHRRYRERHRERLRIYYAEYRRTHPELKQYCARWHHANLDRKRAAARLPENRAKQKAWREENRELARTLNKNWRRRNPEKLKVIERRRRQKRKLVKPMMDRAYRLANPARYKASIASAKAKNPELYRLHARTSLLRRRARLAGLPCEPLSAAKIIVRDKNCCHLCLLVVAIKQQSFDHLIPVVRGGATAAWNLALAHLRCNQSRGTRNILGEESKASAILYITQRNERKPYEAS